MTVQAAIERLQVHAGNCTGVKAAPADPPDNLSAFPFAITYLERGQLLAESSASGRDLHTIITEFHVNRTLLPAAIRTAIAFIEEFGDLLRNDPTLDGSCDTIPMNAAENVSYEFGRLEYGSIQTLGIRFRIPVKIRRSY